MSSPQPPASAGYGRPGEPGHSVRPGDGGTGAPASTPASGSTPPHAPPPYTPPPYTPPPYAAPPYALPFQLGHPGRRLLARLIDTLVWSVTATAIVIPLLVSLAPRYPRAEGAFVGLTILTIFGGYFLYDGVQLALWGRTLGKRVARLRVVAAHPAGERLSVGRAYGRAACYPLGFTLIGVFPIIGMINLLNVLWLCWDQSRQCLHDKIAKTLVIDDRAPGGEPPY
jgi:uncharacterized RDD family membrane protein YckC